LHREVFEDLGVDFAHIGTPEAVWQRRVDEGNVWF
jgi:hypothetical protein